MVNLPVVVLFFLLFSDFLSFGAVWDARGCCCFVCYHLLAPSWKRSELGVGERAIVIIIVTDRFFLFFWVQKV